jgi:hypothetical protein
MSKVTLEIFKTITSNPAYHYYEIKIDQNSNLISLILIDNKDKKKKTIININSIDIEQILNSSLPDELEKLYIEGECKIISKWNLISNLPSKLKKLKLMSVKSKLNNLPLGLEVLELVGFCSNCCLDYLPSSLKTLVIKLCIIPSLDNIPSTLENLLILSEYTQDLKNLPSGLKFLHINSHAKINITLPNNIECVIFPEDNNSLRRKLLKTYPKVIYNDFDYKNSFERYNSIEFHKNEDEFYEDEFDKDEDGNLIDNVMIYNNL